MPDTTLDSTDRAILRILQSDSRTPVARIAGMVTLSTSTCWRRIAALEASGVIERFSITLDPEALGMGFQAIVHVQLTRHDRDQIEAFFAAIRAAPEIRECYMVTGQSDCQLLICCADLARYNQFLDQFLFQSPAVASAQTNMVLRTIKRQPIAV